MASQFDLIIGTSLDTKGAEQALDKFVRKTSNTKILNLADGSKQLKTLTTYANDAGTTFKRLTTQIQNADGSWKLVNNQITQVNTKFNEFNAATVETSKTVRKIIKDNGDLVTTITAINEKGESITTTITESDNGLGRLTKTTEVYNDTLQKQISIHTDSIDNQVKESKELEKLNQYKQQLTTTTREEIQAVEREGESYNAVVKTIQEETAEYGTLTTTITTYKNKLGEIVVETEKVNEKGEHVAQTTRTVSKELKDYSNNTNKASQETKTFGQSLSDAFSRLAKYTVAMLPIQMMRKGIQEAITTVKEFDSALIEFKKVSDLAEDSLTNYVSKLAEMGELTGSTMQGMVEASTQFRKSGFNDEDSATLASIAEEFRNVADGEVSAADSASFIISQMKAFNIEAQNAEHIIDAVNNVSNHFAVSRADLSENIGKVSAALAVNGTKFEEVLGMMTAVTEITRNASTASRGLSMISSRLVQVLDDTSSTGKKLVKIYNDLGISLKDENGQMRGTYDILKDLASQWNTLSSDQQKYIALTSAGARQTQNFVALMENFNQAIKATEMAYDSSGSAAEENARVMDSVEKKIEILKSQFQQLVIGKGGLQDFAKKILDIGIAILKFANSDVGKTVIKLTELIAVITLLNKGILALPKLAETLSMSMLKLAYSVDKASLSEAQQAIAAKAMGVAEGEATVTTGGLTASFEALTAAMMANPIMLIVTGLTLLAGVLIYASKKQEEYNETIKKAKEEIIELKKEIYNLKIATQDEAKVTQAEKDRLAYLEKRLELQKQIAGIGLSPFEEAKQKSTQSSLKSGTGAAGAGEFAKAYQKKDAIFDPKLEEDELSVYIKLNEEIRKWNDNSKEGLELLEEKYNQSQSYLDSLENERDRLGKLRDTYEQNKEEKEHLLRLQEQGIPLSEEEAQRLEDLSRVRTELSQRDEERLDVLEKNVGAYHKSIQEIKNYQEAIDEYGEGTEEADGILSEFAKNLNISENELVENANKMHLTVDQYYEYASAVKEAQEAVSETSSTIDGLQDALDKASTALEEYNQNGYLTLDTFQDLMSIKAEYLTALVNENGQLEINQQTLSDLVEKVKEDKIEELQLAEVSDILAYAFGDVDKMSGLAKSSIADAGDSAKNAGDKAGNSSGQWWSLAEAISAANAAASGDVLDATHVEANIQRIHNAYAKLGNTILKTKVNTTKAGNAASSAGKKGAGAAKQAKDAQKELNKELEETKKKYETVIKWISKQYDKEIDKIKKSEKEALKAEESKIKAKEKEKDNALDAIEKEIKALEKEKKALKEQKEALDERKQALKDEQDAILDNIEKRIKVLEKERDALIKPVEARIKALEEERDAITEATQAEIDSINELKEKRQTYWDDQIDALKNANKELKDNLELQEKLDALTKARNTKVKIYKEGQGFVYDVDQNAVNEAQKALDEYLSQKAYEDELARLENLKDAEIKSYNDRLKELNDYKDNTKKTYDKQLNDLKNYKDKTKSNYDEQIENLKEYKESVQEQYEEQIKVLEKDIDALEKHMDELDKHKEAIEEHKDAVEEAYEAEIEELNNHKEAVQEAYEAEIEEWENYKQQFEDLVNAYEEQQNKLLFQQLTGITDESNNWMTRLDNLAEFVRKYNELQKQLDTGNTDVSNTANMNSGSAPSGGYSGSGGSSSKTVTNYNKPSGSTNYTPSYNKKTGYVPTSVSLKIGGRSGAVKRYANGIDSIRDDEIAIVGENPNREVVIGSKINNGDIMSLGKGTGVVNAESTKTLAGMLNQVGQFGASGFGSGNGVLNNNINNDSLVVNGVTIEGSNISDPETFVNGLLNMKAEAIQRAYRHR